MRRFKQQLSEEECLEILRTAKRGVLAVLGDEGYPYAVPLDIVYEDGKIYFHCAKEGHKLDAILREPKCSFCVLSEGVPEPDSWWFHFSSVISFGKIAIMEDPEAIREKLILLGRKYMPTEEEIQTDILKNGPRANVLELTIEHMTGKRVKEN